MNLIINKVMEFEIIHIANDDRVIEIITGTAVFELNLSVCPHAGLIEAFDDVAFMHTVEHRSHDLPAEQLCNKAEMNFQHLRETLIAQGAVVDFDNVDNPRAPIEITVYPAVEADAAREEVLEAT